MGHANISGPSVRHSITLSPRLTEAVEQVAADRQTTVSEVVRVALAAHLGDPSLAEMRPRGYRGHEKNLADTP